MLFSIDSSNYLHAYQAYRIPKGTTVKNAAGEDVVLSDEEDKLVLTKAASRQLVNDRRDFGSALTSRAQMACEKTGEEAQKKMAEDQAKALAVFRSMSKGNIVPSSDESRLMEFDDKLYQTAKMAQALAQMAKKRAEKKESEWDEKEEEEYKKKMEQLRSDADEAINSINSEFGKFSEAQQSNIVEIDAANIDFSSFKTINLGGVIGEFIDLSF